MDSSKSSYRISISKKFSGRAILCFDESRSKEPFRITVKGEGTLIREEIETEISEDFYNQLKDFVGKPPIKKNYFVFNCGGYPLTVSVVDDGAFIYAEIEFESEEQARDYQFPIDDAIEVTDDSNYKMKNYWLRTRN